ncbi:DNA adenine methylase [Tistrella mobilis]
MARTNSPLRYPGGKSCLIEMTAALLRLNDLERGHYAEPYAGGAGLALSLLYGGHVSDIHINDIDPSVWAFWHCALHETDQLIDLVMNTPITIDEWVIQRDRYRNLYGHQKDKSEVLALGFSAFFLNRTNRSGIINGAGVIGGLKQDGKYKIDCRFNREDLCRRIKRVSKYQDRIHLTKMDAINFVIKIDKEIPKKSLIFIDPPYFKKGSALYTSFYVPDDHAEIAKKISAIRHPWVLTYDNVPEIRRLYKMHRQYEFNISYSVREKRKGSELLVASKRLHLSDEILENYSLNCVIDESGEKTAC